MSTNPDPALALALRYLKAAERTEAELRGHLVRKGVAPDDVERVVTAMAARKFVSDSRVAEREVELAKGDKKTGREKTRSKLLARGADAVEVEKALAEYSEASETEVAVQALHRRFGTGGDPHKAARFLAARGFSEETVRAAVERRFPGHEW